MAGLTSEATSLIKEMINADGGLPSYNVRRFGWGREGQCVCVRVASARVRSVVCAQQRRCSVLLRCACCFDICRSLYKQIPSLS
jgi:hypothetical protein